MLKLATSWISNKTYNCSFHISVFNSTWVGLIIPQQSYKQANRKVNYLTYNIIHDLQLRHYAFPSRVGIFLDFVVHHLQEGIKY